MGRSISLGRLAGIQLKIHWSFSLVIAWVLFTTLLAGSSLTTALVTLAFVLVIFGCVVLHELGHALAARAFGINTKDITLLPIGGVARLERIPRNPLQELVVALAGPAVNVVIAGVLFLILWPLLGLGMFSGASLAEGGFLPQLMLVNVALVVFNMIPAFPMDGGRVLRAILALFVNYGQATNVASAVGQLCAIGIGLLGFTNPFLFIIAIFVFFGARAEAAHVAAREEVGNSLVRDGMLRNFKALPASLTVGEALSASFDGPQRDYPVVGSGLYLGMLSRNDLLREADANPLMRVGNLATSKVKPVRPSDRLVTIFERAPITDTQTLPVIENGELIGLLDLQDAALRVQARRSTPPPRPAFDQFVRPPVSNVS